MRLWEFDNLDRFAHKSKDKKNRTVEERLAEIEESVRSVKDMFMNFKKHKLGRRSSIESILGGIIDDISDFFDFCNHNSNDDEETREYLDKLTELYTAVDNMLSDTRI